MLVMNNIYELADTKLYIFIELTNLLKLVGSIPR